MKIVSWNVNGIRAVHRKEHFKDVFALSPDVLCIQETKAHPDQLDASITDIVGYHSFFNPSQTKKGYSGTAIYTKQKPLRVSLDIPQEITEKHELDTDAYGEANREGRVIAVEFPELYVVTVYTPNAKDDLSRVPLRHQHWDPAFLEYCVTLQNMKPVVFCGDLNVAHTDKDLARPKENTGKKGCTLEERAGFDNMLEEGFVDTFRTFHPDTQRYSWWSAWGGARERNVGWRIDYVLASQELEDALVHADIHEDIYGSDHCPVSLEVTI